MRTPLPLLAALLLTACPSPTEPSPEPTAEDVAPTKVVSPELLARTWPMEVFDDLAMEPWRANPGWQTLVEKRDLRGAVEQLGPQGGLPAARAHAEAAALFRQGALVSAHAIVGTYADTAESTDPVGVSHLLTVGYAVTGDLDRARAQAERFAATPEESAVAWHAPWKDWLDADATWPPDLSGLPLDLPEPQAGLWPTLDGEPHYLLVEQEEAERQVRVGDPGALVALALWHEAVARKEAGDAALVDVFGARYRLPVEPRVESRASLPMELLLGSDLGTPEDAAFTAALEGSEGLAAVEEYADRSLLATLAQASRVDGKVDAQRALDLTSELRKDYLDALEAKAASGRFYHRAHADALTVGALRVLSRVAELEGSERQAGILMLNARDKSLDAAACPVGLLHLVAWDAGYRNVQRGPAMLHDLIRRYPSLEVARYSLDVLSLRVQGRAGGGGAAP